MGRRLLGVVLALALLVLSGCREFPSLAPLGEEPTAPQAVVLPVSQPAGADRPLI